MVGSKGRMWVVMTSAWGLGSCKLRDRCGGESLRELVVDGVEGWLELSDVVGLEACKVGADGQ